MASVESLRTRIEELCTAVKHHEEIIHGLEKAKSEARGHLNRILDPLTQCPLEISSEIFILCLPSTPSFNPLIFLRVCRSWRDIALATPSLWAALRVECPCRESSQKALDPWFGRAAGLPLSLTISGSLQGDQVVPALVKRHAHRLQNLHLNLLCGEELEAITMPFVSLKSLAISQGRPIKNAPQRYLSSSSRDEHDYYSYDPFECVQMLCAAPNLVECTFEGIQHEVDRSYSIFNSMRDTWSTHLCLKHLLLGTEGSDSSTAEILNHLALPALETLAMKFFSITVPDFLAFLTRSSPPLRSLKLPVHPYVNWETVDAESLFQLIPSLTHLELTFARYDLGEEPFESLVIHPLRGNSLPNLSSLTIRGRYSPNHLEFKKLVDALAARRAFVDSKLSSFAFLYSMSAKEEEYRQGVSGQWHTGELEEDVLLTLQALSADGMEIHVGRQPH
ncbi:F-box domain-containing protein [Mycena venus]|uniref:F-box domain-containing protein n=1 Tax=Mycena venus TaxID=2733690 RepID=A0A8H6WYQ5_9AGAR|nr:F-box domain-containing protein [Mycena venus]